MLAGKWCYGDIQIGAALKVKINSKQGRMVLPGDMRHDNNTQLSTMCGSHWSHQDGIMIQPASDEGGGLIESFIWTIKYSTCHNSINWLPHVTQVINTEINSSH